MMTSIAASHDPPSGSDLPEWVQQRFLTFGEMAKELGKCTTERDLFLTAGRRLNELDQRVFILMLAPDGKSLRPVYHWAEDFAPESIAKIAKLLNLQPPGLELSTSRPCAMVEVLSAEGPRLVEDAWNDVKVLIPKLSSFRAVVLPLVPSWRGICTPIRIDSKPVGILTVFSNDLGDDDCPTIGFLADLLGAMLQSVRRLESPNRRREQLALANRVAQEVNAAGPSLENLTGAVVDVLAAHPGYQRVQLGLLRGDKVLFMADDTGETSLHRLVPGSFLERVARRGEVVRISDLRECEQKNDPIVTRTTVSLLAVPLMGESDEGQISGLLWVESDQPDAFDDGAAAALQTVARTVATGLENVERFEQIDTQMARQARRLHMQAELGRAVTGTLDYDAVLYRLLDWTAQALGTERNSLILIDNESGKLHIPYSIGSERESVQGFEAPLAGTLTEWVQTNCKVLCIPDARADGWHTPYLKLYPATDMPRNLLFVPLVRGDDVIGVLAMMNKAHGTFDGADVELVRAISPWATIATENAQMYRESLEQTAQFERAVAQMSQALATSMELDETLDTIMEVAENMVEADASAVTFLVDGGTYRDFYTSRGLPPNLFSEKRLPIDGLFEQAIVSGRPVTSDDLLDDERVSHRASAVASGMRTAALIPLVDRDEVLGALTLYRRTRRPFHAGHLALLHTFAGQAALAIERARMVEKNREQAAYLDALLDTTSEAVVVLNGAGHIEYSNRSAQRLYELIELSSAELAGESRAAVDTTGRHADPDAPLRPCSFGFEVLRRVKSNDCAPFEVSLTDVHGRPRHQVIRPSELVPNNSYLVITSDVTEERQLDQLRYEFLRNIQHELRTPLAAVLGFTQMLKTGDELSEDERRLCDLSAYEQARRLQVLVEDLQIYTLLADSATLSRGATSDLKNAILSALDGIRSQYAGLHFDVQIADGLPPVALDMKDLRRVIRHLLDNAAKFSPSNGSVEVRANLSGYDEVRVAIQDWGIGIESGRLEEIFAPFHQLDDRTERKYQGIGLGLALARFVIASAGGTIRVDSAPGRGSTFTISLPAALSDRM